MNLGFLIVRARLRDFVSGTSDLFKGYMATNVTPGRQSEGAHAKRFPSCHQHSQAGSDKGVATTMHYRLVVAISRSVV